CFGPNVVSIAGPAVDKAPPNPVPERFNRLTRREWQVLELIAEGASDANAASELGISVRTVESHVRNIMAKLDVRNRTEAALMTQRAGLTN
ncbi:MAG: response regulator transcription factor, partial [Dehalococcoidia bacterium]